MAALPQDRARRPRPDNRIRALELVFRNGKHVPQLRCDGCHELIEDGAGNVIFEAEDLIPTGRFAFVHKVECPDGRHRDIPTWLWQDLGAFLYFLLKNTGYTLEGVKETADFLAMFR